MRSIEEILKDEANNLPEGPEQTLLLNASNRINELQTKLSMALKRNRILDALEAGGVDNWEWYGDSIRDFNEENGITDDED